MREDWNASAALAQEETKPPEIRPGRRQDRGRLAEPDQRLTETNCAHASCGKPKLPGMFRQKTHGQVGRLRHGGNIQFQLTSVLTSPPDMSAMNNVQVPFGFIPLKELKPPGCGIKGAGSGKRINRPVRPAASASQLAAAIKRRAVPAVKMDVVRAPHRSR